MASQDPPCTSSDESEWDDEDSELGDEDDTQSLGWEPSIRDNVDNMSVSSNNTDPNSSPPSMPFEDLRNRTWVAPHCVKFPNPRVGEPIHSDDPTNNTYATRLGGDSNSNPYSPFASKLDWEVAKWAKLQGPSSTSFAELLKIEGVT
jgi:hypothetical protein